MGVDEGWNNESNICPMEYLTARKAKRRRAVHNLGRIHGNGKEKAHKAMSELLEKILSNDNMNDAYKRVCAKKEAGGVDEVKYVLTCFFAASIPMDIARCVLPTPLSPRNTIFSFFSRKPRLTSSLISCSLTFG